MLRVNFDDLESSKDGTQYLYQGEPLTGVAFELWPNGRSRDEVSFVDGMRDGVTRSWSETGVLVVEEGWVLNRAHGMSCEWFQSGRLKSEQEFEFGTRLWQKEWSEDGALTKHYILKQTDAEWKYLQSNRERLGQVLKMRQDQFE